MGSMRLYEAKALEEMSRAGKQRVKLYKQLCENLVDKQKQAAEQTAALQTEIAALHAKKKELGEAIKKEFYDRDLTELALNAKEAAYLRRIDEHLVPAYDVLKFQTR